MIKPILFFQINDGLLHLHSHVTGLHWVLQWVATKCNWSTSNQFQIFYLPNFLLANHTGIYLLKLHLSSSKKLYFNTKYQIKGVLDILRHATSLRTELPYVTSSQAQLAYCCFYMWAIITGYKQPLYSIAQLFWLDAESVLFYWLHVLHMCAVQLHLGSLWVNTVGMLHMYIESTFRNIPN